MKNINFLNLAFQSKKLLTVLCYITMFASSWIIISSFTSLMDPEVVSKGFSAELQKFEDQFEQISKKDPEVTSRLEDLLSKTAVANTTSNMRDHSLFSLISNILTLIGASLMLRLKRNGFRLYLLGTILGIVTPLLVFGTSNLLGIGFAFYAGFFGLLFTILYATKLKYLNQ